MRYIRYASIALFAVVLIAVALANREMVEIRLIPEGIADLFTLTPELRLPLFLIVYGGILVGLLVGFVWEWMREYGERAEAARQAREIRRLQREVDRLKEEKHEGKDEVLALLEKAS